MPVAVGDVGGHLHMYDVDVDDAGDGDGGDVDGDLHPIGHHVCAVEGDIEDPNFCCLASFTCHILLLSFVLL